MSEQNSKQNLIKLMAMRGLYGKAKMIFYIRTIIALGFSIAVPIFLKENTAKHVLNLLAFFYLFINALLLESVEANFRREAAKIQELFDSDVLGLSLNLALVEDIPLDEEITANSELYRGKPEEIRNWYPEQQKNESSQSYCARCQKTNVLWDLKLRTRVFNWLIVLPILALVIIFLFYYCSNKSVKDLFESFLIPVSPLCFLTIQYLKSQHGCIKRLSALKKRLSISQSISVDEQIRTIRENQDIIFIHRSTAPFVPDWVYGLSRLKYEKLFKIFKK